MDRRIGLAVRFFFTAVVLGQLAALACGGDEFTSGDDGAGAAGGAPPAPTCNDICETRAELGCAGETRASCEAECAYYAALVRWCEEPAAALEACLGAEPSSSFGCADVEGPLHIQPGVCTTEREALVACWYEGPEGGLPPSVATDCQTICDAAAMYAAACASPTCHEECLNALDPTKSCDGVYGAYVDCAAGQPASNWTCGLDGKPTPNACGELVPLLVGCLYDK